MNAAQAHLLVNHLPLFTAVIGCALMGAGLWRKKSELIIAAHILLIVAGVGTLAAVLTGEGAEEIVEDLAGVSGSIIHEHEEAGELARWFGLALAGFSLFVLLARRRMTLVRRWGNQVTLALGILVTVLVGWTAYLGGPIRHPEITGAAPVEMEESGSR